MSGDTRVNTNGTTPEYECDAGGDLQKFEIFEIPTDSIVTGLTQDETELQVKQRLEEQYFVATQGDYRIHATLTAAGDCPQPTGDDTQQALVCAQEAQAGPDPDPGNEFIVGGLTYYYFLLDVEKIE